MKIIEDHKISLTRRDFLKFSSVSLMGLISGACTPLRTAPGTATPDASETGAGWVKSEFNPVLGGDLGTCFDMSVLKEGQVYRMWFSWRPKDSIALVESPDGIHWNEPLIVLPPGPTDWEKSVNRPSVIKVSDTYHMWYTGQTAKRSWIGYATSQDGKTWNRGNGNPVLSPDEAWEGKAVMCPDVMVDPASQTFRMWYSGGAQAEPFAIGYATSPDGVSWTKHAGNPIFKPQPDSPWEQERVAANHVVQYNGWHIMFYIGFSDIYTAQIGMARSRDGITGWQRHPENPIIRRGRTGWDMDAVYKPYSLQEADRWLLWYNGRTGTTEQIGLASHAGLDLGF